MVVTYPLGIRTLIGRVEEAISSSPLIAFVSTVGFHSLSHPAFLVPDLSLPPLSPSLTCVCVLRPVFHQIQLVVLFPSIYCICNAPPSSLWELDTSMRMGAITAFSLDLYPGLRPTVVAFVSRNEWRPSAVPFPPNDTRRQREARPFGALGCSMEATGITAPADLTLHFVDGSDWKQSLVGLAPRQPHL